MIPRQARRVSLVDPQVRKHRPDYGLLVIAIILLGLGLIVMYAISPALAAQGGGVSENYFVTKQLIAIILGVIVFVAAAKIPISSWVKWQIPLIIISFILCLATVIIGGISDRWIHVGFISFQPVELVKFTLITCGAVFLAKMADKGGIKKFSNLKPILIVLALFAFVIVALQRDLGSAVILMSITGLMVYIAGLPIKKLVIITGLALTVIVIAISTTAYRRDRLLTFMQPARDCVDAGYHACQALIAVGSGGVFGRGLGHSVQAYGYLPEAANDSIFAIFAEKFGFIGVVILIGLIGSMLFRILKIMQRAPNKTTQIICAGAFAWLGFQSMVNIGAMIGLLPLKGITLPFISYGGTSLIFTMAALGVVFQISSYTSMRKSTVSFDNEGDNNEGDYYGGRNSRPRYTVTRSNL
jgi:cell division protein FtsW